MEPRDYQLKAVADCRHAYAQGARAVLLVLPTGGGKTVIGSLVVAGALAKGKRVLWVACRRELVDQAAERLPAPCGYIMAGRAPDPSAPVQVASLDTVVSRELPPVDLVVYDEAHHAVAATSRSVLARLPRAALLGLTATPVRGDGAALGDVFNALVLGPSVRELTDAGHLVPVRVVRPGKRYGTLSDEPVRAWQVLGEGRPGFAFHRTIRDSRAFAEQLSAQGVVAAHVDGETKLQVRQAAVEAFRAGEVECLSSVNIFTEGVDVPRASFCLLARGCDSAGLYMQMVGRVLRPHRGKHDALVVDLKGVSHSHGLPDDDRVWSLEGEQGVVASSSDRIAARQCVPCGYYWRPLEPNELCPRCGHDAFKPEKVVERKLIEARKRAPFWPEAGDDQRKAYRAKLLEEAKRRRYRTGWVEARMRWAFGG